MESNIAKYSEITKFNSILNILAIKMVSFSILLYLVYDWLYINKNHEQRFQEERVDHNQPANKKNTQITAIQEQECSLDVF